MAKETQIKYFSIEQWYIETLKYLTAELLKFPNGNPRVQEGLTGLEWH